MEKGLFAGWSWGRAILDAVIGLLATLAYYIVGRFTISPFPVRLSLPSAPSCF